MFGSLITLVCAGIVVVNECNKARAADELRERCRKEGVLTYTDRKGMTRYTETGEWCCQDFGSCKYDGHHVIASYKDGRIIRDITVETIKRINNELIKAGVGWIYKEYPDRPRYKHYAMWSPYSLEKKKPFHTSFECPIYGTERYKNAKKDMFGSPEKHCVICYYDEAKYKNNDRNVYEFEYISLEEAERLLFGFSTTEKEYPCNYFHYDFFRELVKKRGKSL